MMNLKNLSSDVLLSKTLELASNERELVTETLWHLREIESRRLYAERGYSSLWEFCVRELKYSEGQAHRRISSMRLLKTMPEFESAVEDGSLSVSTLSQVHSFLKSEKKQDKNYTLEEKREILESCKGKSKRETDFILMDRSPEWKPFEKSAEKERVVAPERIELRFTISQELMNKLNRIKELRAHCNPSLTYEELLEYLAETVLQKLDPELRKVRPNKEKSDSAQNHGQDMSQNTGINLTSSVSDGKSTYATVQKNMNFQEKESNSSKTHSTKPSEPVDLLSPTKVKNNTRWIPAPIRRAVWKRDRGCCVFQDSKTGRKCGSRFGLEIDHLQPYVLGGANTEENLRLLCKAHNLWMAEQVFGFQV